MEDLLYLAGINIVIIWAVTFLGGFITEDFIHILLVFATIAFGSRAIKSIIRNKIHQSQS
jgi:hypothetical protein